MAYFDKLNGRNRRKGWRATATINGVRYYLGRYLTKEEAEAKEQRFKEEQSK